MRAVLALLLCAGLVGCRKKTVVVAPPPPPPPPVPVHKSKRTRAARPRTPVTAQPANASVPTPTPMGEFVDPADRPRILAEIDSNLREASSRLPIARSSLTLETIRQIEALLAQAQDARAKNQLLTAERLSARALALTR